MTWLMESPWPALWIGLILEVLLAIALVRTGRGAIIGAMVLVLALSGGLIFLERVVVTEREEVENTLDDIAAAVEANDVQKVLAAFSPKCPRVNEVRSTLSRVKVRAANVGGDFEVTFNRLTSPPSAKTRFTGYIDAHDNKGEIPYEHIIRKFQVTLQKQGDRWLIADFSDADPRGKGR